MGRPTWEELQEALATAARMREKGEDEHHLAKALLNMNYRLRYLEKVLEAAEYFLLTGQDAYKHTELKLAIEEARRAERQTGGEDAPEVPAV